MHRLDSLGGLGRQIARIISDLRREDSTGWLALALNEGGKHVADLAMWAGVLGSVSRIVYQVAKTVRDDDFEAMLLGAAIDYELLSRGHVACHGGWLALTALDSPRDRGSLDPVAEDARLEFARVVTNADDADPSVFMLCAVYGALTGKWDYARYVAALVAANRDDAREFVDGIVEAIEKIAKDAEKSEKIDGDY